MDGYADMLKAIWAIRKRHGLSDREIVRLLDSVSAKYRSRVEATEDEQRDYLRKLLFDAALQKEINRRVKI
ncbi:MAG: hypothetical protein ACOCZR_05070 [Halanaerobiales bacterium]